MILSATFLILMFLAYNYLIFELIDTLLENPKLKRLYRIPLGIVNTVIALILTMFGGSTSWSAYLIVGALLLVEFVLFYQDKFLRSLFCMLACLIHIMAVRSLSTALFAIVLGKTIFEVANEPLLLSASMGVTFALLNVAVLMVIKFIPAKSIKIINQHSEQILFMVTLLSVFCIYLLMNARVYVTPISDFHLTENQITAPFVLLLGTYIMLFFAIKTSALLGYKEQNEQLQQTVEKDRQYRKSVEKNIFRIIEVNFSQNFVLSGFEEYKEQLGEKIYNYSDMMDYMMQTVVHAEEKAEFSKYSSSASIVKDYESGTTEISFDYRRLMPDGQYVWMRVFTPLMRDETSGDVKGFVQIKNIDQEKKQQLALQHKAEIDSLTGLYNKGFTEKLIVDYLSSGVGDTLTGALFVIDIDNFKTINDRLGHLYGDAVLSELSESLRAIFRDYDIVGRIGGDEFLVFAKGPVNHDGIVGWANDICKAFLRTYTNEQNEGFTVSSSIGIAVLPKDGVEFEMLFKCADAALYTTKAKGKNGYSFYDKGLELPYVSNRTEIDTHGGIQKSFRDNRIEYVFRMLHGSEDTKSAIESVLELIAKNFGFSRANIFEFNELSTHFNGVFEWCATGIPSVIDNYRNMPVSEFDFVVAALEKSGGMFAAVPDDFPEYARESYTSIGIKSIVHFSIKERDQLIGVIAFQNCVDESAKLSTLEFDELRTICQVLSVFMVKQLSSDREQRHHQAIETVMDNMNSIAYVVDRENFDIFYENQNVSNITGHSSIGTKCYRSYRGLDGQCEDCPLRHLSDDKPRCTLELYTEKFDLYTRTDGALIEWSNDRKALLISSVDITEYKRNAK